MRAGKVSLWLPIVRTRKCCRPSGRANARLSSRSCLATPIRLSRVGRRRPRHLRYGRGTARVGSGSEAFEAESPGRSASPSTSYGMVLSCAAREPSFWPAWLAPTLTAARQTRAGRCLAQPYFVAPTQMRRLSRWPRPVTTRSTRGVASAGARLLEAGRRGGSRRLRRRQLEGSWSISLRSRGSKQGHLRLQSRQKSILTG